MRVFMERLTDRSLGVFAIVTPCAHSLLWDRGMQQAQLPQVVRD